MEYLYLRVASIDDVITNAACGSSACGAYGHLPQSILIRQVKRTPWSLTRLPEVNFLSKYDLWITIEETVLRSGNIASL